MKFWIGRVTGALASLALLLAALPVQAAKVACIGDSITFGYELPSEQSYPAVLQGLLGSQHEVRNFGRNGATVSKQGDNPYWNIDLFAASTEFRPDIAVIMLGTNDSKPDNWSKVESSFEADYGEFIRHYQDLGATVFVGRPPPAYANPTYWQIHLVLPHVDNVIAQAGVHAIDVNQAMTDLPQYFKDDVHPNEEGAAFLAQVIHEAIASEVAATPTGGTGGTGSTGGTGGTAGQASGGAPQAGSGGNAAGSLSTGGDDSGGTGTQGGSATLSAEDSSDSGGCQFGKAGSRTAWATTALMTLALVFFRERRR